MHSLLSSPIGRVAACLLALLTNGAIRTGEGALDRNPGSHLPSSLFQHINNNNHDKNGHQLQQQKQHHKQQRQTQKQQQQQRTTISDLVVGISGGANANSRRRKHHASRQEQAGLPDAVEVSGADVPGDKASREAHLDGIYLREWDVNGAPHFKRRSKVHWWKVGRRGGSR